MREKKYIELICDNCNSKYSILKGSYYHRKGKHRSNLCKNCLKIKKGIESKEYWSSLSEEEKSKDKKRRSINSKNYQNSLSKEEKNKNLEKLNKGRDNYNSNLSGEEKIKRNKRLHKQSIDHWSTVSKEEKDRRMKELGEARDLEYQLLNEGEKKFRFNRLEDGYIDWRNSLSIDDLELESKRKKEYYNNLNEEDKKHYIFPMINGWQIWYNNLTVEEYQEQCRLQAIEFNKQDHGYPKYVTEIDFSNDLRKYIIEYKYQYKNETMHEDFNKLFPYNVIINSNFINPYKAWDFIIYTKHNNILVDVDGSIHDSNKTNSNVTSYNRIKYILKDYIQFNDSQRLYQTDGMDAYIIEAYDNNITNNTKVLDIKTNKYISYKEFLTMIQLMNYTDKELREIL